MKVDLRDRCKRCRKMPRGKMQAANFARYTPFCSYACKEWYRLEEAQKRGSDEQTTYQPT